MRKSHDLSLPEWGPYSKRFFGISHRADAVRGHRFDLTVIPSLYRRTLEVPDGLRNSNYLPWLASADLSAYSYRQQLEWKDRVFVDIAFVELEDSVRLIRCNCVNHTERDQNLAIHLAMAMELNGDEQTRIKLPEGGMWLDVPRMAKVSFATPRPTDGLNPDGTHCGEMRSPLAVNGSFLGCQFGGEAGDSLVVDLPRPLGKHERTLIRYRSSGPVPIRWNGKRVMLLERKSFGFQELPVAEGLQRLSLTVTADRELGIDGFAVVKDKEEPKIIDMPETGIPCSQMGSDGHSFILHYDGIEPNYGLWWGGEADYIRHYAVDDFTRLLYYDDAVHQHYLAGYGQQGGRDNFVDLVVQPIPVRAGDERLIYAVVVNGTRSEVDGHLQAISGRQADFESAYKQAMARCVAFPDSPWQFSQERMAAVMLTNVVYPIYVKDQYVRHHTPGRQWDSLYTWDSGFIGLGFLEFDRRRAEESLNAYLTEPGDDENAFIHHGSMVPVQIYLLFELWNRTGDDGLLMKYYASVRQYYEFMIGRNKRSTTRSHSREMMVSTWDYSYNSGGWDDYPPQWEIRRTGKINVLPVVPTAHMIRCAKMLGFMAEKLAMPGDLREYAEDVKRMTDALQTHSWDPEAEVFSYVVHDKEGNPMGFFRAEDGSNYNQGLDGLSPLLAGAVTPEQREIFWRKLRSPRHFWTSAGLSTVDQCASYSRTDGYWNGAVWLPYMYFFWKAALNDGQVDFAWQLASTALNVWERETSYAYACFEQFNARTGRGQGWHHFSALSSPSVIFHAAYTATCRLTCGNDWHCQKVRFFTDGMEAELSSSGTPGMKSAFIVNLPEGYDYEAWSNGQVRTVRRRLAGCYEILVSHCSHLSLWVKRKVQGQCGDEALRSQGEHGLDGA